MSGQCLVLIALILILIVYAMPGAAQRDHYGAADEPRAGLNRALSLDMVPGHGWASMYLPGYRADSASAMSHMMRRD